MSPNAIDPRLSAPYRLYFWANENVDTHKGPHVHVESGDGYAEFWIDPVRIKHEGSYTASQRARARLIVEKYEAECLAAWEEFNGRR